MHRLRQVARCVSGRQDGTGKDHRCGIPRCSPNSERGIVLFPNECFGRKYTGGEESQLVNEEQPRVEDRLGGCV